MMKQTTPSRLGPRGRDAALLIASALLALLGCRGTALAQSAPTGPAGGDLAGSYPNPTLAADRVRKTGDSVTGQLSVGIPNTGNVPVPFVLFSGGNPLSGRGVAMQFQVPSGTVNGVGSSTPGGRITAAWGANAQTWMSFSAYNGAAMAEVFRLDGRGYVGVGTSNPSSKLHVVSGTDSGTALLSLDTGVHGGTSMAVFGTANNESGFDLSVYRAGQYFSRLGVTAAGGHVYLQPGATGNVGVGTSTPGYRLDVQNGQVNASGGLCIAGDCRVSWAQAMGGSGATQWTTSGTSVYYNSGSVGVGTSTPGPAYKLDVGGSVNASGLCLGGDCKTAWSQVGGAPSQWTTSGTSVYYGAGSVGIGAAAPGARLDVGAGVAARGPYTDVLVGAGGNNPQLEFYGPTRSSAVAHDEALGGMVFYTNGPAFSPSFFVGNAGRVGVGTTAPARALSINAAADPALGLDSGGVERGTFGVATAAGSWFAGTAAGDAALRSEGSDLWVGTSSGSRALRFVTDGAQRVVIDGAGRVGVGTSSPQAALDVEGDVKVSGNLQAKFQDVAEWVPSTQRLRAGTVVVLDAGSVNHVVASGGAYDTKVAGVVSAEPGVILGVGGEGKLKVATTGRVRVRVDASRGAIRVGDLLVTGDREGVAMKSVPVDVGGVSLHRPGTIIGKALEPLEKGTGDILVLLSLQ